MKRFIRISFAATLAVLLLALAASASAQDWARARLDKSPRHREWVTLKHGNRAVQTFVVYPEAKDKRPVVLVIHEIFGMTDWAEEVSDEIAEAGYIAVAPDLLSGMAPNGGRTSDFPEGKAVEAVSRLDPEQITADLDAAADYGLKLPASNGKLFVVGFCWGGGMVNRLVEASPEIAAGVAFYGVAPPLDQVAKIKAKMMMHYAGLDDRVNATRSGYEAALKQAGVAYTMFVYPDVNHAFHNDTGGARYNEAAAKLAWQRTVDFFHQTLGGA